MESVEHTPAPLVSVVVAVYNGEATLRACLESVLDQTLPDCELVVIDGASSDGTPAILHEFDGTLASWISEPDRGIYDAWNKALTRVHGEWIQFLGADDQLADPGVLARLAPTLRGAVPAHRIVYAPVDIVDHDGRVVRTVGQDWASSRAGFLHTMTIPHQGVFHHRSLFEDGGGFHADYRICGDYEFLLREVLVRDPLFVPGRSVVAMGDEGISNLAASSGVMAYEFHRARHAHGLTPVPAWASFRVFRVQLRGRIERAFGARAADRVTRAYQLTLGRFVRPHGR